MTRTLVAIAVLVGWLGTLATTSSAQVQEDFESTLDPWHLTGSLFVPGGPDGSSTYSIDSQCIQFHDYRMAYNSAQPWEDPPPGDEYPYSPWLGAYYGLNETSEASLSHYTEQVSSLADWTTGNISYLDGICNVVHESGIMPVSASYIAANADDVGIVQVNVIGPTSCDSGYILMASASYWFSALTDSWAYVYGTDWDESFSSGGLSVTGEMTTTCELITESPGEDFASIADAVPQGQSNVNPTVDGLTGLDTWLWYEFDEAADSELGPYTVTLPAMGTTFDLTMWAWVDMVMWDPECESNCNFRGALADFDASGYEYVLNFDDGPLNAAPVYYGGAGTEDEAAAKHLYETKGEYVLSTATVWTGFYTYEGVNYEYSPIVIANALPYTVREIRATPIGP